MIMTYNYYLEKLKNEVLKSPAIYECIENNPILISEFKKSIKTITPKLWNEIETPFKENVSTMPSIDFIMVYTILASKLGKELFQKDITLIENLIDSLLSCYISPYNYSYYAKVFLNPPFYNLLIKSNYSNGFPLFEIILKLIKNVPFSQKDMEFSLKMLHNIQDEPYTILIDKSNTLESIYFKIYSEMKKANEKEFTYNQKSFKTLDLLLQIIDQNDKEEILEIKEKILEIEKRSYNTHTIIHKILTLLEENHKIVIFRRRKKNGPC